MTSAEKDQKLVRPMIGEDALCFAFTEVESSFKKYWYDPDCLPMRMFLLFSRMNEQARQELFECGKERIELIVSGHDTGQRYEGLNPELLDYALNSLDYRSTYINELLSGLHTERHGEIWAIIKDYAELYNLSIQQEMLEIIQRMQVEPCALLLVYILLMNAIRQGNNFSKDLEINPGKEDQCIILNAYKPIHERNNPIRRIYMTFYFTRQLVMGQENMMIHDLPESLVIALPGKKLDEVVETPYTSGLGIEVTDARFRKNPSPLMRGETDLDIKMSSDPILVSAYAQQKIDEIEKLKRS